MMGAIEQIMRPGVHRGISNAEYHAAFALSNTGLSWLARSPEIFYARALDPNRPPERERAGQLEGTLAHCAILEPEEFAKRYAVVPADAPRRPTEAQWNAKKPSDDSIKAMDWWRQWMADNAGRDVVTHDQYETAMRQAESVRRLPEVAELLSSGMPELSAFWEDRDTGVLCKCRPDWTHDAGGGVILLDVKTYSDASPREFSRQIARKGYYRQDAHYSTGFEIAAGVPVLGFVFVSVETEYPYASCAVMLDDTAKAQGRRECRRLTDLYAECLKRNEWPGYSSAIELVGLPKYMIDQPEEE